MIEDSGKVLENGKVDEGASSNVGSTSEGSGNSPRQFNNAKRGPFRGPRRPKQCIYCVDSSKKIDYKDPLKLYRFVSDRSRILSRRVTGLCSHHQKKMSKVIKLCRNLSLMR